jgi:hypothetical protein
VSKCFLRQNIHAGDPFVFKGFLSLHGVVFDVLVASLALQLPFMEISESMSNHDSEIVGADGVD